jgi:ribonuclease BN (tRNA processing enzyme)
MNTFFASITHTLVGNRVLQARAVRAQLAAEWLNDGGLHVILPGTGSPLADNTRAGPCAVVIAGGEYLIIDVGQRSFNRQSTMGLPTDHLTGILLTHFHSIPGGSSDSMDSTVVFERNGLKVIAFNVDHRPVLPAYGYRFEYNGRVAVVSGDTCKCDQLIKYSKGADILVSEASSCHVLHTIIDTLKNAPKHDHGAQRTSYLVEDVIDYHIDVQDVVDIASTCQVPVLALTHLVPPPSDSWILLKMWLSKLHVPASWNGRLIVGRDGDTFHLPSSPSKKIVTTNLVHGKWENIKKLGKVVLFGVLAWLFIKSRSRL